MTGPNRRAARGHLFTLDPSREYPVLDRAEGVYVWDAEGRRYLDAIAGIGVATIGYGRREVVDAMAEQAARLPYAVGNIFSNEPALRLAERIGGLTPGDLDWVHFTSGGSEAVEVALKLARQFHVLRGEPETGTKAEGPCVFELPEATLVLPPGWHADVDERGTIAAVRER